MNDESSGIQAQDTRFENSELPSARIYLTTNDDFVFQHNGNDILVFKPDGDIYVRGELSDNNKEVVNAVKEFFGLAGILK